MVCKMLIILEALGRLMVAVLFGEGVVEVHKLAQPQSQVKPTVRVVVQVHLETQQVQQVNQAL
jgi:hypothetical protein